MAEKRSKIQNWLATECACTCAGVHEWANGNMFSYLNDFIIAL